MIKKLVLFFTIKDFQNVYLYKDVGLIPYYLCKEYNLEGEIVFSNENTKNLPKKFRNLELKELKYIKIPKFIKKIDRFKLLENINFYSYLLKNIKKIDYLMFFHYRLDKIFFIVLYKLFNKNGKIYIKLDSNGFDQKAKSILSKIRNYILSYFTKYVDLFSIETEKAKDEVLKYKIYNKATLEVIKNGFDEDYLIKNRIKINSYEEKENIIITVGRLGTYQKNTELLLETLKDIDLKNWQVILIGPYTKEFKKKYENFIEKNKKNKNKILLLGNIDDKNLLYHYYKKAKVFVLTSRWEGSAIVFPEALNFGNYIITTDVGGASAITNNGKIGKIISQENSFELKKEILDILNNKINLKEKINQALLFSKEFNWNQIIKNKKFKELFEEN